MLHRVKVKLKQELDILRGIKGVQVPHRWYGPEKTRKMLNLLNDNGFLVFGVSDSLEEISLINSALLT
ncbi:MAG: hypothetical protein RL013_1797 [Bacteroidota bacterium]|jgi:hypothetical protein